MIDCVPILTWVTFTRGQRRARADGRVLDAVGQYGGSTTGEGHRSRCFGLSHQVTLALSHPTRLVTFVTTLGSVRQGLDEGCR